MKYYLKEIIPRLQKYSASLDQSSFLVDKPWVVSDNGEKFEKLIFKRDGSVILSINGDVTIGKWEYLPEAQALLVDYGDKKKLYRHQYLDDAVLALKIDGPDREDESYYLLANELVVPDLDVKQYLKSKYIKINNIKLFNTKDGQELQLIENPVDRTDVMFNGEPISDGEFINQLETTLIKVSDGKLEGKYKLFHYEEGVSIWQSYSAPHEGDRATKVINGKYELSNTENTFHVTFNNGKVVNVVDKYERKIAYFIIIFFLILIVLSFF